MPFGSLNGNVEKRFMASGPSPTDRHVMSTGALVEERHVAKVLSRHGTAAEYEGQV